MRKRVQNVFLSPKKSTYAYENGEFILPEFFDATLPIKGEMVVSRKSKAFDPKVFFDP
ncbi:MAG: hypothetical protein QG646_2458 [Euryarchaeota archaeon]|nr:hypothetical protein [Euryarchaeota archaeon]